MRVPFETIDGPQGGKAAGFLPYQTRDCITRTKWQKQKRWHVCAAQTRIHHTTHITSRSLLCCVHILVQRQCRQARLLVVDREMAVCRHYASCCCTTCTCASKLACYVGNFLSVFQEVYACLLLFISPGDVCSPNATECWYIG